MREQLDEIFTRYQEQKGVTIQILKEIQEEFGYLPEEALEEAARFLGLSKNDIFGVATFYEYFRLAPQAKHRVKLCLGTVCYVMGCDAVREELEGQLGIKIGERTADGEFCLERLPCFGTCEAAPMIEIDGESFKNLTPEQIREILAQRRS